MSDQVDTNGAMSSHDADGFFFFFFPNLDSNLFIMQLIRNYTVIPQNGTYQSTYPCIGQNVPPPHLNYYLDPHQGEQTQRSQHHKYAKYIESIHYWLRNRQKYWKMLYAAMFRSVWKDIPGSAPKWNRVFCGPCPIPPKGSVQIRAVLFCAVLSTDQQNQQTETGESLLGTGRRYRSHFYISVTTAIRAEETHLTHLNRMASDKSWGCSR